MRYLVALCACVSVLLAHPRSSSADTFGDPGFATEVVATVPPFTLVGLAFAPDGRLFVWQKNGVVRVIKNGVAAADAVHRPERHGQHVRRSRHVGSRLRPELLHQRLRLPDVHVRERRQPERLGPKNGSADTGHRESLEPRRRARRERDRDHGQRRHPAVQRPSGRSRLHRRRTAAATRIGERHVRARTGRCSSGSATAPTAGRRPASAAGAGPRQHRRQDPADQQGRHGADGQPVLRRDELGALEGVAATASATRSGSPSARRTATSGSATSVGTPGKRSTTGRQGREHGWPCFEGNAPTRSPTRSAPECLTLPQGSVTFPYFTYDHSVGSAVIGGPFYNATLYPAQYRGNYFFADYTGNFIKRVAFDAQNNPVGMVSFATDVAAPVSLAVGPDGMIYYLSFTTGRSAGSASTARSPWRQATPTYGYSPLTVVVLERRVDDPAAARSATSGTSATGRRRRRRTRPTRTQQPACRRSRRASRSPHAGAVVDGDGPDRRRWARPPVPTITSPADGTHVVPGQTVTFQGSATDPDEGPLGPSRAEVDRAPPPQHPRAHVRRRDGRTGASSSRTTGRSARSRTRSSSRRPTAAA